MNPGIHDIPATAYHADPCDQPSLSASLACVLLNASPLHAWTNHPKLNPNYQSDYDPKFSLGTVAHALLLEGRETVHVVHADSWRTKDAQAMRDHAVAEGKTPMLAKDWDAVQEMVLAAKLQLDRLNPRPFTNGKPEQTIVWTENGVVCRSRVDWITDDHATVFDLKTTSRSANPERFSRTLFDLGYDVKAAFYLRGVEAVTGRRPEFQLVVVETAPPYALSVVGLTPHALELANAKVDWALATWRRCLETNDWPGYDQRVAYADPPGWHEAAWLEREAREAA